MCPPSVNGVAFAHDDGHRWAQSSQEKERGSVVFKIPGSFPGAEGTTQEDCRLWLSFFTHLQEDPLHTVGWCRPSSHPEYQLLVHQRHVFGKQVTYYFLTICSLQKLLNERKKFGMLVLCCLGGCAFSVAVCVFSVGVRTFSVAVQGYVHSLWLKESLFLTVADSLH